MVQAQLQGQERIRSLWREYYPNTDGIIFVVDSADLERMDEAAMELQKVLKEEELERVPLLVFANKQDLVPRALPIDQVAEKLALHAIKTRQWYLQSAISTTGEGLQEGFGWLIDRAQR